MTKEFVYDFIKRHYLAVIATVTPLNEPEAAVMGIAVTHELEIIFDTVTTSRKYQNLILNPAIAIAIGWDGEETLQFEGTATVLTGPDAQKYRETYFQKFNDRRNRAETWPDIVHFKVTPKWLRYSKFGASKEINELIF